MGIYYSTDIGFGIAGEFESDWKLPEPLQELSPHDDSDDGETPTEWLAANGFPRLSYDYGGDSMSGPGRWSFFVKKSSEHFDRDDYEPIRRLINDGQIDREALEQIERLRELLHHEHPPAWLVLSNIS
jgi:hypothetical protein